MNSMSQNCTTDFILSPKYINGVIFATRAHKNGDFDHKKYLKIPKRPPRASIRERASNRNNTVHVFYAVSFSVIIPY